MTFINGEIGTRNNCTFVRSSANFPITAFTEKKTRQNSHQIVMKLLHFDSSTGNSFIFFSSWRCVYDDRSFGKTEEKCSTTEHRDRDRASERRKFIHKTILSCFSAVYLANITALPFHILYFCLLLRFFREYGVKYVRQDGNMLQSNGNCPGQNRQRRWS